MWLQVSEKSLKIISRLEKLNECLLTIKNSFVGQNDKNEYHAIQVLLVRTRNLIGTHSIPPTLNARMWNALRHW